MATILCINYLHLIQLNGASLLVVFSLPVVTSMFDAKIALLVYKISLKIQTRKSRTKDLDQLVYAYFDLQDRMQQLEQQITQHPQDNDAVRFISDYIKKMQNEQDQIAGKEMSKLLYNISDRLKNLEEDSHKQKELFRRLLSEEARSEISARNSNQITKPNKFQPED